MIKADYVSYVFEMLKVMPFTSQKKVIVRPPKLSGPDSLKKFTIKDGRFCKAGRPLFW